MLSEAERAARRASIVTISKHVTESEWVERTRIGSMIDCRIRKTEEVRLWPATEAKPARLELSVSYVEGEKTCMIPMSGYSTGSKAAIAKALEAAGVAWPAEVAR